MPERVPYPKCSATQLASKAGAISGRAPRVCSVGARLSVWEPPFPVTSRPSSKGALPSSSGPSRRALRPLLSLRASSRSFLLMAPERAVDNRIYCREGLVGGSPAAFGRVTRRDQRQHECAPEPLVDPHALNARHLFRELGLQPCGPGEGEARPLCHPEDGGQERPQREVPLLVLASPAHSTKRPLPLRSIPPPVSS